jgi:hypothetical protein
MTAGSFIACRLCEGELKAALNYDRSLRGGRLYHREFNIDITHTTGEQRHNAITRHVIGDLGLTTVRSVRVWYDGRVVSVGLWRADL